MPQSPEYVLITGASSGIGAAIAREIAMPGVHLGLLARRRDRLEAVAAECIALGAEIHLFPCDLTDDVQRQHLIQDIESQWPRLDCLINNAGFGWYGHLRDMPWETAHRMITLHSTAVTQLTMEAIRLIDENRGGMIININSIISDLHVQGAVLYAATKTYEQAFSFAADRELRRSGIRVCCLKPGPVRTDFFNLTAQQPESHRVPGEKFAITPQKVARRVAHLMQHPRRQSFLPWYYCFMPVIEICFGWFLDLAGPVILKSGPQ